MTTCIDCNAALPEGRRYLCPECLPERPDESEPAPPQLPDQADLTAVPV